MKNIRTLAASALALVALTSTTPAVAHAADEPTGPADSRVFPGAPGNSSFNILCSVFKICRN